MKNKISGLGVKKIVIILTFILTALLCVNTANAITNQGVVQLTTDKADDAYPAWSPDGSKIAFTSYRSGNADIWIMNSDGSNQKQLTTNKSNDIYSRWVNTTSVVYKQDSIIYGGILNNDLLFWSDRSGNPEIWRMLSNGSNQESAFRFKWEESTPKQNIMGWISWMVAVSPSENKIAFLFGNPLSIVIKDVDTDTNKILLSDNNINGWLTFSPDGKKLAFVSYSFGNPDIWVINIDGTNLKQLTSDTGQDAYPAWSPDGSKIAFASDRSGDFDIWVMNSDGSNQQRLTSYNTRELFPTWDPTGTKIAFSSGRLSSFRFENLDILVMQLSFDERASTIAQTTDIWYKMGVDFYQSSKYKEAIEAFDKAIAIDPNIKNAWALKGMSHSQLGENEKAIESYKNSIRVYPNNEIIWVVMGQEYYKTKNYNEALNAANKSIIINPDYDLGWDLKGNVHFELKQYKEAEAAFGEVVRINPDGIRGWQNLGAVFNNMPGKQQEANKALAKADEIRKRSSVTAAPTATSAPQTPSAATTSFVPAPTPPLDGQEPNKALLLILFSAIAFISAALLFKPMMLKYYRWKMRKWEEKYDGTPLKKLKEVLGDEK